MQLILLVVGLILVLVSPPLFASAVTVGWICLAVFAAICLIQLVFFIFAASVVSSQSKSFNKRTRW